MIVWLIKLLALLPFRLRRKLGAFFGWCFYYLSRRDREFAELQLQLALPELNTQSTTRSCFIHFGQTVADTLGAQTIFKQNPGLFANDDIKELVDAGRCGQGLLVLSAHTGNWDLLGKAAADRRVKLNAVARRANRPAFQAALEYLRDACGVQIIWRGEANQNERLVSLLRSGQAVAALIDQDLKASSVPTKFFGLNASTPTGAIALAKRSGARIACAFSYREQSGNYRVVSEFLKDSASIAEIAQDYSSALERFIRAHPEQWCWFHKRWRTDEEGVRRSSADYLKFLKDRLTMIKRSSKTAVLEASILFVVFLSSCRGIFGAGGSAILSHAEEYSRQGKTEEAIAAYNDHIEERLNDSGRPEWENPYFYELIIGDLYLKDGKVTEALASYELAETHKVDNTLISDRYRYVASWYEKQGDLPAAMEVLIKYRDRDSLLFDAVLDRMAKELVTKDQTPSPSPTPKTPQRPKVPEGSSQGTRS